MDKRTFIELFNKDGWLEAIEYKDRYVPKVLYKYYPLFDSRYVEHERENQIRLDSLRRNKIWISNYENFNDPFEFKMLTLDRARLKGNGWDIGYIERILEEFKKRTLIACFSSSVENNMPLWAHYTNNHLGYCVKYSIINPRSLFPVSYEPVGRKQPLYLLRLFQKSLIHLTKIQKSQLTIFISIFPIFIFHYVVSIYFGNMRMNIDYFIRLLIWLMAS